jgi:hypothetical protein
MSDTNDLGARDLSAFAMASGQPNQPMPERPSAAPGHALVRPTTGLSDRVMGAQPVAKERDEAKILQKINQLASAAGSDWFYRYPVKLKDGGQDWIEGPSIKLANDVARLFGNNINEIRELDVGDAWVFYARFTDIETGFSMERAYRQRKAQVSIKTKDADRQMDIAYQIGQSKAIRNCIVNSLQIYADYAFEQARDSLVERIGKDLDRWRERTLEGLAKIPRLGDVNRVERIIGRASKDWLAPDIARIVSMMKAIADGMATVEEVFPPIAAAEPKAQSATPAGTGEGGEVPDKPAEKSSGGGESGVTATAPAAAATPSETQAPPAAGAEDPVAVAYARGQKDRAAGVQRRAVPPEYRDKDRLDEGRAWQDGWDKGQQGRATQSDPGAAPLL